MVLIFNVSVPAWAATLNSVNAGRSSNTVTITGTISSGEGKQVTVKVTDPEGNINYLNQNTSGADGKFEFQYKLSDPIRGTYSATVNGEGVTDPAADTFRYSTSSGGGGGGGSSSHNNHRDDDDEEDEDTPDEEDESSPSDGVRFTDIDASTASWAGEAIETLASYGIIQGQGNNQFAPKSNATRAEFAVMIYRLLGLTGSSAGGTFNDVPAGQWYTEAVEAAAAAGYINGRGERTFVPGDTITREEIATILGRLLVEQLNLTDTESYISELSYFNDMDQISSWAQLGVAVLYKNGVISGRPGGIFDPKANATRAEVAVMLYNITKLVNTVVQ